MGSDARVRYTRKVIRDTFFALLLEKSVKQITVTEICKLSEINRATFYKHYLDVYDLLEQIEAGALELIRETAKQMRGENAGVYFVNLLEHVRNHHEQYALIGSEHGDPHFAQKVSACLFKETRAQIFHRLPDMPDERKQFVCHFLQGGGSSVLEYWIQTGMKQEPSVLARLIFDLSDAAMMLPCDRILSTTPLSSALDPSVKQLI